LNYKLIILSILASCLNFSAAFARIVVSDSPATHKVRPPVRRYYTGTSLDGAIFSTATIHNSGASSSGNATDKMGTLRFTLCSQYRLYFQFQSRPPLRSLYRYRYQEHWLYREKPRAETVKRRTYTLGIPIGIKIGNMADKKPYLFLGGGADVPFNYKEKTFVIRNQKTKMNEWLQPAYTCRNALCLCRYCHQQRFYF
jgi:hypothetical protein